MVGKEPPGLESKNGCRYSPSGTVSDKNTHKRVQQRRNNQTKCKDRSQRFVLSFKQRLFQVGPGEGRGFGSSDDVESGNSQSGDHNETVI